MNKINIRIKKKLYWPVHPKTVQNNKSSLAKKYKPWVLPVDVTAEGERRLKVTGNSKMWSGSCL